jgi:hypothetical protein
MKLAFFLLFTNLSCGYILRLKNPVDLLGEKKTEQDKKFEPDTEEVRRKAATAKHTGFVDYLALEGRYKRVFSPNANGDFKHCGASANGTSSVCQRVFSLTERAALYDYGYNSRGNFGPQENITVTSLDLGYLRAIRAMLSRECKVRIQKETKARQDPSNVFVGSGLPSEESLTRYLKSMLGLAGTSLDIGFDGSEYINAIDDKPETVLAICIAIGMDPLVLHH